VKFKILSMFILVLFLAACSTTRGPSAANQMQIRVAQLERKLDRRDREIGELRDELAQLKSQEYESDAYDDSQEVEEFDFSSYQGEKVSKTQPKTKDDRIIRVAASAKEIQKALKNAGYYEGAIDGKFGRRSKVAVTEFQKDHDLVTDGIIGKKTWIELKSYLD